jgi:hypothetical protein
MNRVKIIYLQLRAERYFVPSVPPEGLCILTG